MDGIVIRSVPTSSFLKSILSQRPRPLRTHLVICSERQIFLKQLHHSVTREVERPPSPIKQDEDYDSSTTQRPIETTDQHPLLERTIAQLHVARDVQLTFCASLPALLAFLALLPKYSDPNRSNAQTGSMEQQASAADSSAGEAPVLALVNPIELHRDTTSFSAQGLSKTFAAAVEAAVRGAQKLVIVECVDEVATERERIDDRRQSLCNEDEDGNERMGEQSVDLDAQGGSLRRITGPMDVDAERGYDVASDSRRDPWMEDIPILNPSTKTFGLGSDERGGWLGRTVKIQDVVSRWCRFEYLNSSVYAETLYG